MQDLLYKRDKEIEELKNKKWEYRKKFDYMSDLIMKQDKLIKELVQENKVFKDAIDRQNKYIESYRTAIHRFDESNRGN